MTIIPSSVGLDRSRERTLSRDCSRAKSAIREQMALGANFRGRYLDFSDAKHPHASSCTSSNTCEQLGFQVSDHGALIPPNASARRAAYFRPNLLRTRVKMVTFLSLVLVGRATAATPTAETVLGLGVCLTDFSKSEISK